MIRTGIWVEECEANIKPLNNGLGEYMYDIHYRVCIREKWWYKKIRVKEFVKYEDALRYISSLEEKQK
jgi:hypothetical protein